MQCLHEHFHVVHVIHKQLYNTQVTRMANLAEQLMRCNEPLQHWVTLICMACTLAGFQTGVIKLSVPREELLHTQRLQLRSWCILEQQFKCNEVMYN